MNALTLRNVAAVSVELLPEAVAERDRLLGASKLIARVDSQESLATAISAVGAMKGMAKAVEAGRESAKAPVLQLGRQLDSVAKTLVAPLADEIKRVEAEIATWQREQARIAAEAERKRQEEIRKAEEAKAKAEAELRAREQAIRDAEEARRRAVAAKDAEAMAAARKAEFEAFAKAQAEQRKLKELEAARIQAASSAPVVAAKQAGVAMRKEPRFEVTDLAALVARRDLVRIEPNNSAILAAIRGGMTECPGLKIWWENVANVRAS